jgi:hypothetical protein
MVDDVEDGGVICPSLLHIMYALTHLHNIAWGARRHRTLIVHGKPPMVSCFVFKKFPGLFF